MVNRNQSNKLSLKTTFPTILKYIFDWFMLFVLLSASMLMAAQMRTQLAIGKELGAEYNALPNLLFVIFAMSALVGVVLMPGLKKLGGDNYAKTRSTIAILATVAFSIAAIITILPDISMLQILYSTLIIIVIIILTILYPPYLYNAGQRVTVAFHLKRIWEYRSLIRVWVRYNIFSRYSQTMLGILWIVLLPLSTTVILAFVFSYIMRLYDIGNIPMVPFLLIAITFWTVFQQGVSQGATSLLAKMGLISQVYFPREIIIVSKLGETLVDFVFIFISMIVINAFWGILPNANYIFLIGVFAIQFILTLGLSFFLGYLTVFIRDIPNLVSVTLQLMFYLTPILYPAEYIPHRLNFLLLINPIAPLIDAYRRIILFNQPPEIEKLYFPIVISCILLYTGFIFLKSRESILADFI